MTKSCDTCKFWQPNKSYQGILFDGDCDEISEKVSAELQTGWDGGYVKHFVTDNDFCCSLWQKKG